ncbi:MAG TPA: CidA/LrgA family protein [Bacillales bacterium]|nr:CidA/LrgA family protein [Bacillales bacterium]
MKSIMQIAGLFVIYHIGIFIHDLCRVPIPGSIIGMLLLFGLLSAKIVPVKWVSAGCGFLLRYMPLLFVPITVGVIEHPELFKGSGLLLLILTLLGTVLVMVTAGHTSAWLARRKEKKSCSSRNRCSQSL